MALAVILIVNQSTFGQNIVFLIIMSLSLARLRSNEIAIAFLIPILLVVVIHQALLNTGAVSSLSTDFGNRLRSTYGFANANQASSIYLSFVITAFLAHSEFRSRVTFFLVGASIGLTIYILQQTDSRTSLLSLSTLLSLLILGRLFNRYGAYRKIISLAVAMSPWIAVAATYYLIKSNDSELNLLLSLRPYLFSQFVANVSVPEFFLGWEPPDGAGVDNVFLMLLSAVGAIGVIFVLFCISYRASKLKPEYPAIIVVALIAASVFESFLLRPEIPAAALFWHVLFSNQYSRQHGSARA
jgi:hypothetical protein